MLEKMNWASVPSEDVNPSMSRKIVSGEKLMISRIKFKDGFLVPLHHHVHEQTTYILEGQLDMIIGGEPYSLTAGMYHVIPSDTPHSAVAASDCKAIDVFSPVREDYKTSGAANWQQVAETK